MTRGGGRGKGRVKAHLPPTRFPGEQCIDLWVVCADCRTRLAWFDRSTRPDDPDNGRVACQAGKSYFASLDGQGVRQQEMPGGTNVIIVPKVLTGTAVAAQATQNTAVQNTDATFGSVSSPVSTIAGGQLRSVQLVEQSPVDMTDTS